MDHSEQRRTVVLLRKRSEEYGIHLMELEKTILVYYIVPDSPASNGNGSVLYVGDRVLAVGESEKMRNRKSVEGLHPEDVIALINSHPNEVSLRVIFHDKAYQLLRQQFGPPDRRSVFSLPGHLSPPPPPGHSNGATKTIRGIRKHLVRAVQAFGKKLSSIDTPTAAMYAWASDKSTLSHSKTFPAMHADTSKRNRGNKNGQQYETCAALERKSWCIREGRRKLRPFDLS